MTRPTLEQHLATLKALELTGADLLVPFPAHCDGEPCQVTAVMERTAVYCAPDCDPGTAYKHLANVRRVTFDPDDVRLSNSRQASRTARERAAATRGRNKGLNSPLRQPGEGVRRAAEAAEANQEARKGVG